MSITQNQIRTSYVVLATVSDTEPVIYNQQGVPLFNLGDSYYNSTYHLIHTVIQETEDVPMHWGAGETPVDYRLYCDLGTNTFYGCSNGELFAHVGSGDITNPLSANLDANNHFIRNLPDAENLGDAVNKKLLDTKANITDVILSSEKGTPNGVATLDANGKVTSTQLALPIASTATAGITKPDGITLNTSIDGTMSVVDTSFYKPNLLEFKWSDHLFNNISWLRGDTFSWQDGSVYTAVYNELLSEYNNESSTTETDGGEYSRSNITKIGNLIDNQGIISNFASSSYATFNTTTPTSSYELVVKAKQSILTANSSILEAFQQHKGIVLRCTNASTGQLTLWYGTGSGWAINAVNTNATLSANAWTYIKLSWNGTVLTVSTSSDGETYTETYSATVAAPDWSIGSQGLGGGSWENYPFNNGFIDLNECYLDINGERYWTGCAYTPIISYKRTPKEYQIVDATQEQTILDLYNSTGVAWYYILDTENTRFKLPRSMYGFVGIRTQVGKYVPESLPNITGNIGRPSDWNSAVATGAFYSLGKARAVDSEGQAALWDYVAMDASRSSSAYQDNAPVQQRATQMYLYFYVGQFNQSATEQTAGLNSELFNDKLDRDFSNKPSNIQYVVETYSNGTDWCRIWSDGWCEQGGNFIASSITITFLRPFINTNYTFISQASDIDDYHIITSSWGDKTTSTIKVVNGLGGSMYSVPTNWRACGYIS